MTPRTSFVIGMFALLVACAVSLPPHPVPVPVPGLAVLEAQTLPVAVNLCWDDDPVAPDLTFSVTFDGQPVTAPAAPCTTAKCTAAAAPGLTTYCVPFSITTAGAHTIKPTATNFWGSSVGPTYSFTVKLPTAPTNPRVIPQ